jgi:hypothetical protein
MNRRYLWALTALALLMFTGTTRADLAWQFTDSSGNVVAGNNFTVGQGQTVGINVYLLEFNGGTILSTQKLASAGVQLDGNNGNAAVNSAANITPNPAFDDFTRSVNTSTNTATLNVGLIANPVVSPDAQNRVLIGTFAFSGNTIGSTTAVTVDPHPSADTVTGTGTVLDALINNSTATITVVAVPEPNSMLLTGVAAAALGVVVGLRRRKLLAARLA